MNTKKQGAVIQRDKDKIIKMHKEEGLIILEIAKRYGVSDSTIYQHFKKWGAQVIRPKNYKTGQRQTIRKPKKWKHWKRKFSPEYLAHRAEITRQYGDKINYIKSVNIASDHRLIKNILNKPYIG